MLITACPSIILSKVTEISYLSGSLKLTLIVLFLAGMNSAYSSVSSKVCSATTKVCVSNVTNELTVKDEELLQACKDCCSLSQAHTPGSVAGSIKGCIPRCQKSCEKAYKKAISKIK